jgi:hypothetical protein
LERNGKCAYKNDPENRNKKLEEQRQVGGYPFHFFACQYLLTQVMTYQLEPRSGDTLVEEQHS